MPSKSDISRAEQYFRRAKDRGGDTKLIARGLLHLVKHLELIAGRDSQRAKELLDRAWKQTGTAVDKKIAEAMWLITKELKKT